ncbi:MAG: sigma 54-interacting transcriptional regulator [Candidatus Brocadiae bacterium]|nr:sigma 54-interacting transcriptional regulator [Candidatus Brocadiia bacterium]
MPKLIIQESGESRTYRLGEGAVTVGRAPTNTIQIRDGKASREHCILTRTDKGWKLVDLESVNGLLVNGTRTNQHFMKFGDRIEIGATSIAFEREPGDRDPATDSAVKLPKFSRRSLATGRRLTPPRPAVAGGTVPAGDAAEDAEKKLRDAIDACQDAWGEDGLDAAGEILDEVWRAHRGAAREGELAEFRDSLLRLIEINKAITTEHNLKRLLEMILDSVIDMTGAERGFIILADGVMPAAIRVARNFDREEVKKPEDKISHSIAEAVVKQGKSIRAHNAQTDRELHAFMSVTELKLRSLLCVPLRGREGTVGCFYIDNRFEEGLFTETHQRLLEAFGDQASVAIENARLWEENQRRLEDLRSSKEQVEKLNKLLEEKVERQKTELSEVKEVLTRSLKTMELKYNYSNIVGRSAGMQEVFHLLDRVTDSTVPVLIQGESGTGKELVARAIHFNGLRKTARFVSENCAAITETLLESELFGHMRGSFTGATSDRKGLFELADGGTLFLDEIGDMSQDMQKKLLRALQTGEIRRVGGKDVIHVDVRVISASNRNLKEMVKLGQFREDLFYRLNVVTLTLPPLRDRREDIPLLVEHFLGAITREAGQPLPAIDEDAQRLLCAYSWPGNIRELENELRRLVALSSDQQIPASLLKPEIRSTDPRKVHAPALGGKQLKDIVKELTEQVERDVIVQVLKETGWVKTEASRVLGISRVTLDAKIEAFGLHKDAGA